MERVLSLAVAVTMLSGGLVALAPTAGASPTGPITNSDFELAPVPDSATEPLAGTPADACYGLGHQAQYGSETTQGQATGGEYDSPDPDEADPVGAAESAAENPEGTARYQAGWDYCVWGSDTGYDLAWVHPRTRASQPAHWSMDIRNPSVEFGYNYDEDPFDREVRIFTNASVDYDASNHNMWQWFGSKHQAWTANAEALEMDVEAGDVSGAVKFILSSNPLGSQGDQLYDDCSLTFTQDNLTNAMDEDGHIAADPVDAVFNARRNPCQPLEQAWDNGDEEDKRSVLGQVRITQVSFWSWERGTEQATVLDDVRLTAATTAAEEAAGANTRLGSHSLEASGSCSYDGEGGSDSASLANSHTDVERSTPNLVNVQNGAQALATAIQDGQACESGSLQLDVSTPTHRVEACVAQGVAIGVDEDVCSPWPSQDNPAIVDHALVQGTAGAEAEGACHDDETDSGASDEVAIVVEDGDVYVDPPDADKAQSGAGALADNAQQGEACDQGGIQVTGDATGETVTVCASNGVAVGVNADVCPPWPEETVIVETPEGSQGAP